MLWSHRCLSLKHGQPAERRKEDVNDNEAYDDAVDAENDEDNHHDLGDSGGELILALTEEEDDQENRSGSRNRKELIIWTAL